MLTREEYLVELARLQMALDETQNEPQGSFAHEITRPKLIKELGQLVEGARELGVTEEDIDELVAELEITIGRRPIELENFWDPRRMSKGYRKREQKEVHFNPPWSGKPPVTIALGNCYAEALRFLKLFNKVEATLVHGEVFGGFPKRWIRHAWVELDDTVYEPNEKLLFNRELFYDSFRAKAIKRYSKEEAYINALKYKHLGPWES